MRRRRLRSSNLALALRRLSRRLAGDEDEGLDAETVGGAAGGFADAERGAVAGRDVDVDPGQRLAHHLLLVVQRLDPQSYAADPVVRRVVDVPDHAGRAARLVDHLPLDP